MCCVRFVGLMLAVVVFLPSATAQPAAELDVFTQLDGETFFAARLSAGNSLPGAARTTSSFSSTRQRARRPSIVRRRLRRSTPLLARLDDADRVKLVAVDLTSPELSEGFVAPRGEAAQMARKKLMDRAPLGATDMEFALGAAVDSFDAASDAARMVVYIGDGVSTTNLLEGEKLRGVIDALVAARVPVSSYAVGPRTDAMLLAVVANQTGGNLYVAEPIVLADTEQDISVERANAENTRRGHVAGERLADWSRAGVAWPAETQFPGAITEVFPTRVPPLRSDRSTVVLGTLEGETTGPLSLAFRRRPVGSRLCCPSSCRRTRRTRIMRFWRRSLRMPAPTLVSHFRRSETRAWPRSGGSSVRAWTI